MLSDTTILNGEPQESQNGNENVENIQQAGNKKHGSWKQAAAIGAAGVAGASAGAGVMYAANAGETHHGDGDAGQDKAERQEETENNVADQPQVSHSEPSDSQTDISESERVSYGEIDGHQAIGVDVDGDGELDVAFVDADDSLNISTGDVLVDNDGNAATITDVNDIDSGESVVHTVSNEDLEGFEQEGVSIVGADKVEGHIAVAYDLDNDDNADIAIVDVDDSGNISDSDLVTDGQGNWATVEEVREAMNCDCNEEPCNVDCETDSIDQTAAQNPDVAPDMPDYMNDAVVDV